MDIVGFIALIIFGGWLTIAGFLGAFAAYGLSGKIVWAPVIFGIIGVAILAAAVLNSPFAVVLKG